MPRDWKRPTETTSATPKIGKLPIAVNRIRHAENRKNSGNAPFKLSLGVMTPKDI